MALCGQMTGLSTFGDWLVYPTECSYYFYLPILGALFILIAWTLYRVEVEKFVKADLISSLGVASIVTIFLALIGTLIKNTSSIPVIQQDIFLYVFSVGIVFIGIWFFKR